MMRRARITAAQLLRAEASLRSVEQTGSPSLHHLLPLQHSRSSSFSSLRRFATSPASGGGSPSRVIAVKGDTEYLSALSLAQENQGLAVVYFTAKWCGPCKMISPTVDELSTKYDKATFLKVDIDEEKLSEIVSDEKIASVPTFRFFQGGKSIGDVIGANANALKEKLAALIK